MARCRWSLIPANPRPLLDARRERPVRAGDFEEHGEDRPVEARRGRVRDRVGRDFVERDFAARVLLELALLEDFFEPAR